MIRTELAGASLVSAKSDKITDSVAHTETKVEVAMDMALTPPQSEVVAAGLLESGFNCLLQMPTGSGKTWLAEQAIHSVLASGQRAIYLTPLRALADELTLIWRQRFAPHPVGVYTGDYGANGRTYPTPYSQAKLLVMTPERLDACTRDWRSHWHWLPDVDLVVVDEFHLLGEPQRGPRLEGALLRLRRLNPFARILALSATLGNRTELAQWLDAVEYVSIWRPVPLAWRIARYKHPADKPELLANEVRHTVAQGGKSLVFVQSRRRAEELATYLRTQGMAALHHHAGLNHRDRQQVEAAFRNQGADVLVATATLEMGINLPARQVVLYDLQQFDGRSFMPLTTNTTWQRAGRAGRRGLDEQGEVVLMAPTWDRTAERYAQGQFEPIRSQLTNPAALSEQIVAEVASGLAKTVAQMQAALGASLAAHQHRLASLNSIIQEMEAAGLLQRKMDSDKARPVLTVTPLARVAVRHYLVPATVLSLRRAFATTTDLTFFDLLLLASSLPDSEPDLAVDFEELDALAADVAQEPTLLLQRSPADLGALLGISGRRLLAAIKMALVMRWWTRTGEEHQVADRYDCYPFEVRRLQESTLRLLAAMQSVATLVVPLPTASSPDDGDTETVSLVERITTLHQMITAGLDETTVTLTLVPGLGPVLAERLAAAGIQDLELLAQAEVQDLAGIKGLSPKRASAWIAVATDLVPTRSALRYQEFAPKANLAGATWPAYIDPYRLRRSIDLTVTAVSSCRYLVRGGLEPHWVSACGDEHTCDCADAGKGHQCKHILAVKSALHDPEILRLVRQLRSDLTQEFHLFSLWLDQDQITTPDKRSKNREPAPYSQDTQR